MSDTIQSAEAQASAIWDLLAEIDEKHVSVDFGEDSEPFAILDKLAVFKLIEARDDAIRADEARKQEQRYAIGVASLNKPIALADSEAPK
jgi:hypothetical protein